MAPRVSSKNQKQSKTPSSDPHGMFQGMVVFLVSVSIQPRRLQIWKQRLMQMGAVVDEQLSKRITHIFAADSSSLRSQVNPDYLKEFKGKLLLYEWLEKCLQSGKKLSEDAYLLKVEPEDVHKLDGNLDDIRHKRTESNSSDEESFQCKRTRISHKATEAAGDIGRGNIQKGSGIGKLIKQKDQAGFLDSGNKRLNSQEIPSGNIYTHSSYTAANPSADGSDEHKEVGDSQSLYSPPDLNRNITEIFGKLINIYRALGDDRRSFSYYKAIPVIEKLPFKIDSVDQVKHLPAIGKSMQDHINEIVTTGKLSKLEHFEKDEKARTVTLFGEVWGIGPATALKLYEKGHRTLDDLKKDESLTNSQRIGLQFFEDIKKRIPRHEVKDMEMLLQEVGEEILPGVVVVCGGSYRRGKASCGDLDIIITHPDGESHKGFLPRFVQHLKEINFLREVLVFSTHSTEGTDSGVDTYFGLCTYPGQEQRHRIDLKVYPRSIYAFGLIAWTGNDVLNRRLRLLAESKGYRLDDTGLFLATQGSSGKRGAKLSVSVSCSTEKEVFDVLGFPWLEPHERNL